VKENIGVSITKILKKRKMSQRQLALKIGKPATQLNKWILGKNEIGIYVLLDIANTLNIGLDELIGRKLEFDDYVIANDPAQEFKKAPDKELGKLREDVDFLKKELAEIKKYIIAAKKSV
jgi:transcriptional regulator with XRE-family HTH domain